MYTCICVRVYPTYVYEYTYTVQHIAKQIIAKGAEKISRLQNYWEEHFWTFRKRVGEGESTGGSRMAYALSKYQYSDHYSSHTNYTWDKLLVLLKGHTQ